MASGDDRQGPSQEDTERAVDTLLEFATYALFWLEKECKADLKVQIISNFIARGTFCLDSIRRLFLAGNYHDCVILQRSLADRLLLLIHLIKSNEFVAFQAWSRQRQYKEAQKILDKPGLRSRVPPSQLVSMLEKQQDERRWLQQQQPPTNWKRPNAKEVAKDVDLLDVYLLSYEYPSGKVHPMANDGEKELQALLRGQSKPDGYDLTILRNSLLNQMMLLQSGLYACGVMWRRAVMDFLLQLISFVNSGSVEYLDTFNKLLQLGTTTPWCKPID